jgi:hypothetical protein
LSPEYVSLYDNPPCGIFVTLRKSFPPITLLSKFSVRMGARPIRARARAHHGVLAGVGLKAQTRYGVLLRLQSSPCSNRDNRRARVMRSYSGEIPPIAGAELPLSARGQPRSVDLLRVRRGTCNGARGHPSDPTVRLGRQGQRGPAVPAARVRRRVRLGPGHRPSPADPAVRPVQAVRGASCPALANRALGTDGSLLTLCALGTGRANRTRRASFASRTWRTLRSRRRRTRCQRYHRDGSSNRFSRRIDDSPR